MTDAVAFCAVGALWGLTNPLIKRGLAAVDARRCRAPAGGALAAALAHAATPSFLVPQLLNLLGSALFAAALPAGRVSVAVPLANGVALAATAAADAALGEGLAPWPGLPALALVLLGVALCGSA
jgi:hypothetical protein